MQFCVAPVGFSIACTGGLASGLASLFACLVITQLSYQVKVKNISQLMACLMFSKCWLNVLMVQQFLHTLLYCYLLIFLQYLVYNQKILNPQ